MALDPKLLEILACPEDKGPLYYFPGPSGPESGEGVDGFLLCPECRRRYEVRGDIPVMLVDEAETLDQGAVDDLLARAEAEGIRPTFDPSPGAPA